MFLALCIVLIGLFSLVVVYPFRAHRGLCLALWPCLMALAGLGYQYWGGFGLMSAHLQKEQRLRQAQALLQTIKSPAEVIRRLQDQLQHKPNSAQGWYLLGRLYSQQQQWAKASTALARAYRLEPQNTQYVVQYAYSLWQSKKGRLKARTLLLEVLQKDPKQGDALALLAEDAWQQGQVEQAKSYWRRLLVQLPPDSPEAKALRKTINQLRTFSFRPSGEKVSRSDVS